MQGAMFLVVTGTGHGQYVAVDIDADILADAFAQLTLGALDRNDIFVGNGHSDAGRDRNGQFANS